MGRWVQKKIRQTLKLPFSDFLKMEDISTISYIKRSQHLFNIRFSFFWENIDRL